jgi:integrase
MYTQPKISKVESIHNRCFVYFYYNDKRYKYYNGKALGIDINPNKCITITDRKKQLIRLSIEFEMAMSSGWNPLTPVKTSSVRKKTLNIQEAFGDVLCDKLNSPLSDVYKRDLKAIHHHFMDYLGNVKLNLPIDSLSVEQITGFLKKYNTSGTNYMNKRRMLGVLFGSMVLKGYLPKNPVLATPKQKSKATLHDIYEQDQLLNVLAFLKDNYPNLYLCCVFAYGCLIRPHREFRLLKRKHFNHDLTEIHLSGSENKSGRVRVIFVPEYIQLELKALGIIDLPSDAYIVNQSTKCFHEGYFSLQWARAKRKLLKLKMIHSNQTIYSFRHTAAVNVYKQTKDLHLLQQLLGHSNMIVTLKYLRGLGVHNVSELRQVMPKL